MTDLQQLTIGRKNEKLRLNDVFLAKRHLLNVRKIITKSKKLGQREHGIPEAEKRFLGG